MPAQDLLLLGDVANDVSDGILKGHLASESGCHPVPNLLIQLHLHGPLLILYIPAGDIEGEEAAGEKISTE